MKKEYPKPTVQQSIDSWHIVCDLVDLGVPHNFQHEDLHIRSYMWDITKIIKKAFDVMEKGRKKEDES